MRARRPPQKKRRAAGAHREARRGDVHCAARGEGEEVDVVGRMLAFPDAVQKRGFIPPSSLSVIREQNAPLLARMHACLSVTPARPWTISSSLLSSAADVGAPGSTDSTV